MDNPTPHSEFELQTLDLGLRDADELETEKEPSQSQSLSESVAECTSVQAAAQEKKRCSHATPEELTSQSPERDEHFIQETKNSLLDTHSAYPLSGCDDGIAPTEAVDTLSTFHPPVDCVSTIESKLDSDEVGAFSETGNLNEARGDVSSTSPAAPAALALLQHLEQLTEQLALVVLGLQRYCLSLVEESSDLPNSPETAEPQAIAEPEVTAEPQVKANELEVDQFEAGDRVYWINCPTHCERLAPFAIMWIDGEYAKLELFSKLVPLSELLKPD